MEKIGQVAAIKGQVFAESEAGSRVLAQGSPIYAQDELVTQAGSHVEVKFADNTVVSQGENARLAVDEYVYDPQDDSASNMLLKLAQGTLRMVTGKIADQNPEGVSVESPLATIGIRGTGVDMDAQPEGTKVGLFLYDGKDLSITTASGTKFLTSVNAILDVFADGRMGDIRAYTPQEKAFFKAIAPIISEVMGLDEAEEEGEEGEGGEEEVEDELEGEGEGEGEDEGEGEGEEEGEGELEGEGEGFGLDDLLDALALLSGETELMEGLLEALGEE
ncbi:MAG: FecR family protein, partial [Thermodesulfobacteriota bacterium]|nr:FecR family protein [Thermodesulfobacteriota bacterium]